MNKLFKKAICILLTLAMAMPILVGCGGVRIKVEFIVKGETYKTVDTDKTGIIQMPADPVVDGYEFDGWFLDDGEWTEPFTANTILNTPLSESMTIKVYAKLVAETGPSNPPSNPPSDTPSDPPSMNGDYVVNYSALDKSASGTIKVMRPANDIEDRILDTWIAGFKAEYPNVTVIKTNVEISSYSASVKMQFKANALADIIWCNSTNMYDLIANDIALNLDGFMADTEAATSFDWKFDDKEDDFTDQFNMMGVHDGSRYAIPRAIDSVVCFYMKDTVAAAGVDMSQYKDGWTMEQFKTEAIKVREYFDNKGDFDYYPLRPYLEWESVAWPIVKSLGGEFIGSNGEFALTEAKANEVHAFVNDLTDNGIVAPYGAFAGGAAFTWQSATVGNFQEYALLKDKFDVVPFPTIGDNPAVGMGFAGYAINSKVANDQNKLNLVSAFMAYLMSYDGQQKLADTQENGGAGLDAVSIRADLGIDNTDANWHKRYNNFNMAAYVANSQYKVGVEFLGYNATYSEDIIGALNAYVGDYCKRKTSSEAYAWLQEDMDYIFNSI